MEYEIKLEINVKIQENELNINGLIKAMHDFSKFVLGREMLSMLIHAMDRQVCEKVRRDSEGTFENRGYRDRTIQSTMGRIPLRFLKLRNRDSGAVSCPGLELLDCPAYARWPKSLLVNAAGMLPFMSYRQSSAEHLEQHGTGPAKTTVHRRLQELVGTGDYRPNLCKRNFKYLLVDGTGAKFQDRSENCFYSGEVRFAYASTGDGRPYELVGLWVGKDWKACADELYSRMSTGQLEVLICDGEEGISSAFLRPHIRHQRCQWHALRDLSYILYADDLKKPEQEPIISAFKSIPMVGCTQLDFEELTGESISTVKKIRNEIVKSLKDLAASTIEQGYPTAGTYLQRLAEPFVTCLDHYIDTGNIIPITSNIIERQIGLFKNRYSRIGKRWSEQGLIRWFAIAIRKLLPQFDWKESWKEFYGSKDSVKLELSVCSIR